MRHEWRFPGVAGFATEATLASEIVVVAVCARCGQIRAQSMTPVEDRKLDLSGECSEEASDPFAESP